MGGRVGGFVVNGSTSGCSRLSSHTRPPHHPPLFSTRSLSSQHDALFQLEDPELEEGTIGQVLKVGYQLKERVIRPAQVGTVRK